jgi:Protein of unknown function (DUF3574)
MMIRALHIALMGLSLLLSGCVGVRVHDRASGRPVALTLCQQGESPQQRSTLYFGAARPDGGSVDDRQWQEFLVNTVTPAFPDGLTWFAGRGQWRGGNGDVVREDSRIIVLLHDGGLRTQRRVDRIAAAYKQAFAQEAVLQERVAVCARFH